MAKSNRNARIKSIRKQRVRKRLTPSAERPRLSVFRSNRHFYAQIIDDTTHATLVSASTQSKKLKAQPAPHVTLEGAKSVGC